MESSKSVSVNNDDFKVLLDTIFKRVSETYKDYPILIKFSVHNIWQFVSFLISVNNVLLRSEIQDIVDFVISHNLKNPSI